MSNLYYSYKPAKGRSRIKKTGKTFVVQIFVCILLVLMVISVKKFDFAITNKVADVFANQMQKDTDITGIFTGTTEKVRELSDTFKSVSTRVLGDNNTFAFNVPVDGMEAISVFADDGRQVGLDFTVTGNEMQVYAAGTGTITEIGTSDKVGKYVKVNHDKDMYTIYGHCSTIYVNPMDKVKKGDIIASVSSSESPVFRFEMYKDGKAVNPNDYFKN